MTHRIAYLLVSLATVSLVLQSDAQECKLAPCSPAGLAARYVGAAGIRFGAISVPGRVGVNSRPQPITRSARVGGRAAADPSAALTHFKFGVSLGIGEAQVTNILSDGSTSDGGTVTGFAASAEMRYYLNSRWSVGPALLYYSLGSSDVLFGAMISYQTSSSGDIYVVGGKGFRLGYNQILGSKHGTNSGLYAAIELTAPGTAKVNSFEYVGIGYRF